MLSKNLEETLQRSMLIAERYSHGSAMIEHLLLSLLEDQDAKSAMVACSVDLKLLKTKLERFLTSVSTKSLDLAGMSPSISFQKIIHRAAIQANLSGMSKGISGVNVLAEILLETDSYASKILHEQNITRLDIINYIVHGSQTSNFMLSKKRSAAKQEKDNLAQDFGDSFGANVSLAKSESPLNEYCVNLNEMAIKGSLDLLIGREYEINRVIEILGRRTKNNPLLVGEPGVGKTAIVEGLAYKIVKNKVPKILEKAVIYSLDLGALLAGTRYRGDFEERMKSIIKELVSHPHSVLFIDEIHSIIGAGSTNGNALDASNLLKPSLARGQIKCIGSTTFHEYHKHFSKDKSLVRRFQQITVEEPSLDATIEILEGLSSYFEKYHNVRYSDDAIRAAVELSKRFITDRQLPDKAIDVIDETGSFLAMHKKNNRKILVTVKDIEDTVAKIARVPTVSVHRDEIYALKHIEKKLKSLIYGQNEAVEELCSAAKLSRAGLRDKEKPIGCYLFAGPTGVGKTELAIQLSKLLSMNFIRIDMSEYLEQHSVAKLIGAPPGYVGYDSGGLLTEEVYKHPYSVVLLDEIEKAHKDIYNILLQVMDYGTLTDHQGRKVRFNNTIIIMTTNAGASELSKNSLGFGEEANLVVKKGAEEIERVFSPEFRNRLDAVINFSPLSKNTIVRVAEKFVKELKCQLKEKNTFLTLSSLAYEYLHDHGYDSKSGARIMERLINDKIKRKIANEILFGDLVNGGSVYIDAKNNELEFYIDPSIRSGQERDKKIVTPVS
ncbi:MAG: AAA family ATPase [Rickettsiales bacterium]|nr:AAA family ATPase [Rickettsiales bacterium]